MKISFAFSHILKCPPFLEQYGGSSWNFYYQEGKHIIKIYVNIMARSDIQQIRLLEDKIYENIKDYNPLFTFIDFRRTTNLKFLEKPQ